MNILIDCRELNRADIIELEEKVGAEGCWAYHKLRLFLKEQRTDLVYRAKVNFVASALRLGGTSLLATLDHLPETLVARTGQSWQLLEITKELKTLEGRVKGGLKGGLKGTLNKGMGIRDRSISNNITIKDLGTKLPREKKSSKELVIPEWVSSDLETYELLQTWIQQRAEKNKPVSQQALSMALKKYLDHPERLKPALEATIANDWQGIYSPSNSTGVKSQIRPSQNFVNGLHNDAVVKMYEQKEKMKEKNYVDNTSPNGKTIEGSFRTLPEPDAKT